LYGQKAGQITRRIWASRFKAVTHAAVLCAVFLGATSGTSASQNEVSDFAIKAAYLSKFGGFIRWPDAAFSSDTSPITICVIGDSPVAGALQKVVSGRPSSARALEVRNVKTVAADSGCHIIFVGDTDAARVAQILGTLRGSGVLTVTDLPKMGTTPAVINFVIKENHVRFEIDEQAAIDNGLAISSQLLGLAVSVKTRG
jgi:hypothetical protein